jgi:hypothetical protein
MRKICLIVDDGVNFGGTARKLHKFVEKNLESVLGMLVLDSRLKYTQLEKLQIESPRHPFLALYTWPSLPVEVRIEKPSEAR